MPVLLDILTKEDGASIIEPAVISLGMIGDPSAVGAVREYLYSGRMGLVIVMLTTQDETKGKKAIFATGTNGILQKPFAKVR